MLLGYGNAFPYGSVPEILRVLQVGKFYQGFLTYSDFADRDESGELFEAALTFMNAYNEAKEIKRQQAEMQAQSQARARR